MKKLLTFLIMLYSNLALSQEGRALNQQIWCFDQRAVIETLAKDFKETPMFHGQTEVTQYVLYTNDKTGGWTIIAYQDNLGCIVAAGKRHTMIYGTGI